MNSICAKGGPIPALGDVADRAGERPASHGPRGRPPDGRLAIIGAIVRGAFPVGGDDAFADLLDTLDAVSGRAVGAAGDAAQRSVPQPACLHAVDRAGDASGAMAPDLSLHPIEVETGGADRDGRLILRNGKLVGLLVRLAGAEHGVARGSWYVEAMFDGRSPVGALFPTLAAAGRHLR